MKISRHGVMTKEELKTEEFKCEQCGCEFIADYDEYYIDKGSHFESDSLTTYTYCSSVNDVYICSCPECHKIITKTKIRTIEIPAATFTTKYSDATETYATITE